MRRRILSGVGGLLVFAAASTGAAERWATKPFNTWTDGEVKDVLQSSPWAGKASISYVQTRGANSPPIEDVALVSWASALPLRQAAVRQTMKAGADIPAEAVALLAQTPNAYVITVRVSDGNASAGYARSAATTMLAETFLVRGGKTRLAAAVAQGQVLDRDGKVLPDTAPGGPPGGGAPRSGGAPPAGAPAFSMQRGGGFGGGGGGRGGLGGGAARGTASLISFAFAKTAPITLADEEVEFVSKLCGGGGFGGFGAPGAGAPAFSMQGGGGFGGEGGRVGGGGGRSGGGAPAPCSLNIKKKFKLKDMVYNGELAL
jgi:hypothetical protein